MYELHKLLWDIRRRPEVKERYLANPTPVLDEYGITGELRTAMSDLDFRTLYDAGVNPYLLYFCAIQLQVDRAEYYAQLRVEKG